MSRSLPDPRGDGWSRQRRWSERRNNVGRTWACQDPLLTPLRAQQISTRGYLVKGCRSWLQRVPLFASVSLSTKWVNASVYLTGWLWGFDKLTYVKCLKPGLVNLKGQISICIIMNNRWPLIFFCFFLTYNASALKSPLENFLFSSWREKNPSILYV